MNWKDLFVYLKSSCFPAKVGNRMNIVFREHVPFAETFCLQNRASEKKSSAVIYFENFPEARCYLRAVTFYMGSQFWESFRPRTNNVGFFALARIDGGNQTHKLHRTHDCVKPAPFRLLMISQRKHRKISIRWPPNWNEDHFNIKHHSLLNRWFEVITIIMH